MKPGYNNDIQIDPKLFIPPKPMNKKEEENQRMIEVKMGKQKSDFKSKPKSQYKKGEPRFVKSNKVQIDPTTIHKNSFCESDPS